MDEKEEKQWMIEAGVIQQFLAEWAYPAVLVPKPDSSLRFRVDYSRLNDLSHEDHYTIPRMDEFVDSLDDATVFTTPDANSGFWLIPLNDKDRQKIVFTTHVGSFEFIRIPLGLKSGPASFQRALDIALSGFTWKICLVYIDEVVIFS